MVLVLVKHMTRTYPAGNSRFHIFKRGTRLHRTDATHRSTLNLMFGRQLASHFIFVHIRFTEEYQRQVPFPKPPQKLFLDPTTDLLHVIAKVLEANLVLPKVFLHAFGYQNLTIRIPAAPVQSAGRRPENQTIEATERAYDFLPILLDKLIHGVLLCR